MEIEDPYAPPSVVKDEEEISRGGDHRGLFMLSAGLLLLLAVIAVVGYTMVFVMPETKNDYYNRGITLPGPTVLAIQAADFCVQYWYLIAAILVTLILNVELWIAKHRRPRARKRFGLFLCVFSFLTGVVFLGSIWLAQIR
ncbi:MAG: hypothetical protein AAF483_10195 [Planctomycetota bacterium]